MKHNFYAMLAVDDDSSMRYIQIQDLVIDSQLPVMFSQGNEVSLEPKQHALLLLFIAHANQIVSRDQIINDVNQGIIVSDNAVSKMVANLRQLLKDNPKSPLFIKTIPKQGYCFIADVTRQDTMMTNGHNDSSKANKRRRYGYGVTALMFMLIGAIGWWQLMPSSSFDNNYKHLKLQPLTRHSGVEFAPMVSPDKKYLAYTRNDPINAVNELWVRYLDDSQPEQFISDLATSSEMTWSSDSQQLLFTDYPQKVCHLKRININDDNHKISDVSLCNALYISQLQYVNNDQSIIYVAREVGFEPMQIYRYTFSDQSRSLIKQPSPTGSGNYGFDLSNDGKKMLILSADEGSCHTSMFVLNMQSNLLENKGRWTRFINRAIWHHDSNSVINTTNEYSHELVQSQLGGQVISTLVSTSNRVAENFTRFPNGRDYYFTSFQMNNDNELVDLVNNTKTRTFNSSVYDKLPTFSQHAQQWYFLSKRNGPSQIFVGDESTKQLVQVTHFEQEPQVDIIDVSPDGKTLLLGGRKQLLLMSLVDNTIETINVNHGFAISSGWLTNNRLAVTVLINGQPSLQYYNIGDNEFSASNERWQAAFSDPSGEQLFFVEQGTNEIYQWLTSEELLRSTSIKLGSVFGSGLNVKADGDTLTYIERQGVYSVIRRYSLEYKTDEELGKWLFIAGFDVLNDHLLVSYEQGRAGDILKTNFQ
jgi:DNA-binding winged helix-turn-helix (wHTH) protein/Tol biopolymer transport system component